MTRAKHVLSQVEGTQSTPSINKIANPKLEIRNSKQFQMIKNQKVPNKPVSDFDIRISDFVSLLIVVRLAAHHPEQSRRGAKNFVEVVLSNILSARMLMQIGNRLAKLHEIRQPRIEVKSKPRVSPRDYKGLSALSEEVRLKRKIVTCAEKMRRRADDGTEIMPATVFFKELWAGDLIH